LAKRENGPHEIRRTKPDFKGKKGREGRAWTLSKKEGYMMSGGKVWFWEMGPLEGEGAWGGDGPFNDPKGSKDWKKKGKRGRHWEGGYDHSF